MGTASSAITGSLGFSSEVSGLPPSILSGGNMLDPQKTLEREALLRRELQAEIARHERNLRDGEARLPMEEQLRLNVRRLLRARSLI